jgi:hypothetical protein
LGLAVATFMLLVTVAFFLIELMSPGVDALDMLAGEGVTRLGATLALIVLTFLPYWLLGLAASHKPLGEVGLFLAVGYFVVDVAVRVRLIFFPQSSTDAVGLFFFPMWAIAVAAGIWLIAKLFAAPD